MTITESSSCQRFVNTHSTQLKVTGVILVAIAAIAIVGGTFILLANKGYPLGPINSLAFRMNQTVNLSLLIGGGGLLLFSTPILVLSCQKRREPHPEVGDQPNPSIQDQEIEDQNIYLAQQRAAQPQYELGMRYLNGDGIEMDSQKAIDYLTRAAEDNHVEAQYQLGLCYLDGKRVERNDELVRHWLDRAASAGHTEAQYRFGLWYTTRPGPNSEYGVGWLQIAARAGHMEAAYQAGLCYHKGKGGVLQDPESARHWLTNAAQAGHTTARHILDVHYR